ncbi:hypothetical protein P171DRAFT_1767 [Karstenula rhodostoma CBS 690.94]|uniref:Uncharacterized protein n=1 Tax=Karstenula rhodostoma CBS 690.94 TaxID=1392251 RepID=A0A9P4UJ26_9PLEO|nr:hypothetical protein P171DRAFT_1767 [Karstenula rhodostoma CBS 690.94]
MKQMGYRPRGDRTMDLVSPSSLLWFSVDKSATRRSSLLNSEEITHPTWSWTGWRGAITYASLKFGRNASSYTESLRWSQSYKPAGIDWFHFLEEGNNIRHESEAFCAQPYCSQLVNLPWGHHRFKFKQYLDLRHLSLYRFCTSVCTTSNFHYYSWKSYVHRDSTPHIDVTLLGIFNRDGKRCGVLFNPPPFNPPLPSMGTNVQNYSLITISMKKQYSWLEDISTSDYNTKDEQEDTVNGCGCWLNVMLVKKSEQYEELVERVAVGQMHPRAWVEANPTVVIAHRPSMHYAKHAGLVLWP